MRSRSTSWMTGIALACAGLWSSGSQARAEDPVERAATTWRFDVRVLRLSTAYATVEQAPTLPGMTASGVTTATWAELLAALKTRGQTQIVMDRNVTGLPGRPLSVIQTQTEMLMVTERSDSTGVTSRSTPAASGADVNFTIATDRGHVLDYDVHVTWTKPAPKQPSPSTVMTRWRAHHALQGDGTLVLRHAEQDGQGTATEIYVLISWDAP